MIKRKPDETLEQFAIRTAYEHGHFWSPENREGWNVSPEDLPNLTASDPVVIQALRSLSRMDATRYTRATLDAHGRTPEFDGTLGPAMKAFIQDDTPRCHVPDFAPPPGTTFLFDDPYVQQVAERMQEQSQPEMAVGTGNWARCHGIGEFHCSIVKVNPTGLPSHVAPHFKEILTRVQNAYAATGLLFRFVDMQGKDLLTGDDLSARNVNIDFSFVTSSQGWLGLAIVGTSENCGGRIWCRFLSTFLSKSTNVTQIITDWVTLIVHELGHNTGRGHTTGGVMNPTLQSMLTGIWSPSDPSTAWMKSRHGGVAVPIPGQPKPDPKPDPKPPATGWEAEAADLQLKHVVQEAHLQWLTEQVRKLQAA